MQTRFYLAYKAKGDKFNCASCKEPKCLIKGSVEIEAYWQDQNTGKRERITIKDQDDLWDYVERAQRLLSNEGADATEFDLIYAGSGHRVCPIPLFDKETLDLMRFIDLSGEVSPLEVPRLPAYYVALKSVVDSESMRMERRYVPRHDNSHN